MALIWIPENFDKLTNVIQNGNICWLDAILPCEVNKSFFAIKGFKAITICMYLVGIQILNIYITKPFEKRADHHHLNTNLVH